VGVLSLRDFGFLLIMRSIMFTVSEHQAYLSRQHTRELCRAINKHHDMLLAIEVYAVQFGFFGSQIWNGQELTVQFYFYEHNAQKYLAIKANEFHLGIVGEIFRNHHILSQPWQARVYSSVIKNGITTGVFVIHSDFIHHF
jgi:hypothetical protein